jgi:hypothetical protein
MTAAGWPIRVERRGAWLWESVKLNEMVRRYSHSTVIIRVRGRDYETNEGDGKWAVRYTQPWEKCLNLKPVGDNTNQNLMSLKT